MFASHANLFCETLPASLFPLPFSVIFVFWVSSNRSFFFRILLRGLSWPVMLVSFILLVLSPRYPHLFSGDSFLVVPLSF